MHIHVEDTIRQSALLLQSSGSQLFENMQVLCEVLKHLPINFFFVDRAGYIRQCNSEAIQHFNISDGVIVGKHCLDLNIERPWGNSKQVMEQGQTMIFDEQTVNGENIIYKFISVKCPVYDNNKKVIGVSGIGLNTSFILPESRHTNIDNSITTKQSECLQYLIQGKTAKEIAKILQISPRTIEHRIEALKIKFSCNKISELVYKVTHNKTLAQ